MDDARQKRVRRNAGFVAPWLAGLYGVLVIVHGMDGVLPPEAVNTMRAIAGATAIAFAAAFVAIRMRRVPASFAHPLGLIMVLAALANVTTHLALDGRIEQSTNHGLIIVAVGAFYLSWAYWGIAVFAAVACWVGVVIPLPPTPAIVHFATMLFMSIVLSALLHGGRMRAAMREEKLQKNMQRFMSPQASAAAFRATEDGAFARASRRDVVVWFSDLRGFTSFVEANQPETVFQLLNRVLAEQARIVESHGGAVDKFVGDSVVAIFDGAGAERRAVEAAIGAMEAVAEIELGEFQVGIGINAGDVIQGPVGAGTRLDHTVVGDVVNVGARLCAAAQAGEVLMSDRVADRASHVIDRMEPGRPESMQLRGRRAPVIVTRVRPPAKKHHPSSLVPSKAVPGVQE